MTDRTYNVPFLCTGNSARSSLAESRIKRFAALPIDELDRMALQRHADHIGHVNASQEV